MRRWAIGGLVLLGLVIPAFAGEAQWVEVRSPHFSVVTDAGEKRGRDVAVRFEQMRAVFGALMTKAKVTMPIPLQIVAFRNTKEMRQFVPLWQGKPTQVGGLFMGGQDRAFILLDMSVENPWQVVFHEYAHQLMAGNLSSSTQPWFDEGFAEYFSTIQISGKEALVGLPPEGDATVVEQASLMRTADLFRVQQDSSIYNETGNHRSLFYAQSWLVVHYLMDKQFLGKAFNYFKLAVDQKVPAEDAIQRAFGMSASDFDKQIRQYLQGNRVSYNKIPTPAGIETTGYSVQALSEPDFKAVLADVHLHSNDYREHAIDEFEEVLKLDPMNPAGLRGMGYAYLIKEDYKRAGVFFRKAVERNPDDPRVLYYSSLLIEREEGPGLGNDREELAVIQQRLEKAVALDPEFADAYSLLAFTYVSLGNHEQGLRTMLKAVNLNPRDESYRFNLAQMFLANRNFDDAIAVLEGLTKSQNPQLAQSAARSLEEVRNAKLAAAGGAEVNVRNAPDGTVMLMNRNGTAATPEPAPAPEPPAPAVAQGPVRYLKGRLVSVDCSEQPGAVLTLTSGAKTWKLHARDATRIIVIGADKFSCSWSNQKISVNYHETGEGTGELISVEVQ